MVRFKNRYVLCEIVFTDNRRVERNITGQDVKSCVINCVTELHGDYGISLVRQSLDVNYLNPYTNTVMIRCPRGAHKLVMSSLPMVTKIGAYDAQFRTLHLSGSIRCCQKFLLKYARKALRGLVQEAQTKEERHLVEAVVCNSFMVHSRQPSGHSHGGRNGTKTQ